MNFSRSVLFHTNTKVCIIYFEQDCSEKGESGTSRIIIWFIAVLCLCHHFSRGVMLIVRTWHRLQLEYSTLPFWSDLLTPKSPTMDNPTMDNPHDAITRRIDFSKWRDPNKQKYFSGPNLLENLHWNSFNNVYIGWSLSLTKIWPGFSSCVVFSTIFMQWYCVSSVCKGASIKRRSTEMSYFLVWWLLWECYQAHAVQTLVVLAVFNHATSSDILFL